MDESFVRPALFTWPDAARVRPGRSPSPGRLRQLREQIEAGTYDVSPARVAEAMIQAGVITGARPARPS
jgi:anti-sigma-28 factor FlgM